MLNYLKRLLEGLSDTHLTTAKRLMKSFKPKYIKAILVLAVFATFVYLFATDSYSPEAILEIRETIQSQKILGPLIFIGFFTILQPFGIGSHGFILASAVIWPWHLAFVYSLVGATLAGVVSFWFARFVGYNWVQNHIPAKVMIFEKKLVEKQFRNIFVMRIIFFTFAPMQLMFGVTRVDFKVYLLATLLGISPLIFLEVWFGASLFDWLVG